ncbi:hypothetical protein N9917_00670 [Deltaproteobacteria bacterium]|nr:hypothetical protein [Deltaproteobacteria bacterium]
MILQPQKSAHEVGDDEKYEAINGFTEKYGIHGTLLDVDGHELLEVRQLDFKLRSYAEKCEAIPREEKQDYTRALMQSGLFLTAVGAGAQYNVPIGSKRWVRPDEPEHEALNGLPILGYV